MIKRLRFKLVIACMVSLLLVLVIIMGILNTLNYRDIVLDADNVLDILRVTDGIFPFPESTYDWRVDGPRYKSPELPFEIRFFSVLLSNEGVVVASDTQQITALDSETVKSHATRAYGKGDDRGFVDDYRFLRYQDDEGIHIIFLDCGRTLSSHNGVLKNSILISASGLLAVFVLIVILSGRIIKPIADSYDKQRLFITDAGHEIKTPITIIDASAEVLEMEFGENEWLKGIRQQTKRLNSLTTDLIRLSRTEENHNLPMMDFPLSELVEETASTFFMAARVQNKEIRVYIQPSIIMCGHGDSFRQLVSILLDNALKYSPEGASIRLRLERKAKNILLISENESTQPLTKEHVNRLFDRFYRGDSSRSSQTQGYGIGLSIAKAIVGTHAGKISAVANDTTLIITAVFPV